MIAGILAVCAVVLTAGGGYRPRGSRPREETGRGAAGRGIADRSRRSTPSSSGTAIRKEEVRSRHAKLRGRAVVAAWSRA